MAESIHQSALLTPDPEADWKDLCEKYQSFLNREMLEKRLTHLILMSWLKARGTPNDRSDFCVLARYSSASLLFSQFRQLDSHLKEWLAGFVTPSIEESFTEDHLIDSMIRLIIKSGDACNATLELFVINDCFITKIKLRKEMTVRAAEILEALQEQHARMLESFMGTFLRLRFVGASTGGITSSASETHALSLLSVRLSAFAGIGMSHFFASSTSHCKHGDRAYGRA